MEVTGGLVEAPARPEGEGTRNERKRRESDGEESWYKKGREGERQGRRTRRRGGGMEGEEGRKIRRWEERRRRRIEEKSVEPEKAGAG